MAGGVHLSAKLDSILGGANLGGFLRITLCGFGPVLPCIPGTGMLANAGIPQLVGPQVGATPITQDLWGNDVITPPNTFYEISILDSKENVIQSGLYQFVNAAGAVDLSQIVQITAPYGFQLEDLSYQPCDGMVPGSVYVSPGPVIAAAYNGMLMPEGQALPVLSYTVDPDQVTIRLNFATAAEDRVDAFCIL